MSDHDLSHLIHLSFEDAYAQLEKLVEQLETNSLPLEESLSLFEEGQQLSAYCQQLLDKADLRVSKLAGNAGEIVAMSETNGNGAGEAKAANKPMEDVATVLISAVPNPEETTTEESAEKTETETTETSDSAADTVEDDSSDEDSDEE